MEKQNIKILAIETSCDETAAAVIGTEELNNGRAKELNPVILSNVVSSQIDLHAKTGGVVPEVASRAHMEAIISVISEALMLANHKSQITNHKQISNSKSQKLEAESYKLKANALSEITHIAVTAGPGLIGSLLVGFNTAKSIAYSLNLPIVPVNHIEGHIYSTVLNTKQDLKNKSKNDGQFPILALTVSGGHTSLTLMLDHGKYKTIGQTRDDAAGEAFDKVARLLDLGYPGGPIVSKLAEDYRRKNPKSKKLKAESYPSRLGSQAEADNLEAIVLPRPMIKDKSFDFSFSGLKTAVLETVKNLRTEELKNKKNEICAAFEDAAVDVLTTKTINAARKYKPRGVILAGGVAANKSLQQELKNRIENYNLEVKEINKINYYLPPIDMTGDNAAMIGLAAYHHISKGDVMSWNEIKVDSNMKL